MPILAHRFVELGSGVSAYWNGSTISQPISVLWAEQSPLRHKQSAYLLGYHHQSTPPLVELTWGRQAREHVQVVLAHKAQRLGFISPKEGVSNQGHSNNLAIGEERFGTTSTPLSELLLQYQVSIIYKHEPNSEDVRPPVVCDKISYTGHCAAPLCVLVDLKDMHFGRLLQPIPITQNYST
jgi:hypothetical protein